MTDSAVTLLISNSVVAGGVLVKIIIDELRRRNDRLDREQDRLDRDQLACLTSEQLDAARLAGDARLKVIIDEVGKSRSVSIRAFKEANGINRKLERLGVELTGKSKNPNLP